MFMMSARQFQPLELVELPPVLTGEPVLEVPGNV
jgi:hypothetical protein